MTSPLHHFLLRLNKHLTHLSWCTMHSNTLPLDSLLPGPSFYQGNSNGILYSSQQLWHPPTVVKQRGTITFFNLLDNPLTNPALCQDLEENSTTSFLWSEVQQCQGSTPWMMRFFPVAWRTFFSPTTPFPLQLVLSPRSWAGEYLPDCQGKHLKNSTRPF